MIASVHIADLGLRRALGVMRRPLEPGEVPGLRYADTAIAAPLGGGFPPPAPQPGRVGLVAFWEDDAALDAFLADHPVAERLRDGWHTRLRPMRASGHWSEISLPETHAMEAGEPVCVLTLGRLRLLNTRRFLRANSPAADEAVHHAGLLAATGLARPPRFVATFSVWSSTQAMTDYAFGRSGPGHIAAINAHRAKPFHHESLFVRLQPYRSTGAWDGRDPLAARG
jgi:hypothetical protein